MTIKNQIVIGTAAGVMTLSAMGGILRLAGVDTGGADAAQTALGTRTRASAGADAGRSAVTAAINASAIQAPSTVEADFRFMANGADGFAPGSIKTLSDGIYAGVRGDGVPCLYYRLGGVGADGFCIDSFMGEDIATSSVVSRAWDSATAPFDIFVNGAARGDVSSVTFHLTDGRTFSAEVKHNVFTARLPETNPGDVTSIEVAYRSGASRTLGEIGRFVPDHMPPGLR